MTDEAGKTSLPPLELDADKRVAEKDKDFKRACQRYARMRARSGK